MINRFEKEFEELHHTTEEELFTRKKEVLLNEISNLNVIEKVTALLNEYQEITKLESSRQAIQEEIEEIRVEESQKVLEKKKGRAKIKYRKLRKEHEEVSRDFYDKYYEHEDVIGLKRIGFKVDEDDFQELEYVLEELKRQQTQLYREIDALKWDIKTEFEDVRKVDTSNFPPKVTEKINQLQQKVDSVRVNKQRKEVLYEQLKPLIQYREDIKSEIEELKVLVRKRIKLMDIALEESSKIVKAVGIADSRRILDRYPHELSGGMRQRIMISMGLACQSKLLICDEPTTALDVTIQAQILELIRGLKKRLHNSVLFITHNLGVIYELCDKVAVMYAGNIVEYGEKQSLFDNPMHPYTHGLLGAIPRVKPRDRHQKLAIIPGMVPNLIFPLPGCRFHPRCEHAMEICRKIRPELIKQPNGNSVACWLFEKDQDKYEPGSFKKLGDEFKEEIV
ncbi:MAG: ATP-binding cassette domain-containing protein [Candidatus Lokiarchaeota archaeon]|nr:ATP-binding cassette domain-containing protein [Candidatus Lokiarchaeota archaeon]